MLLSRLLPSFVLLELGLHFRFKVLESSAQSILALAGLIEVWRISQEEVLNWKVFDVLVYQDLLQALTTRGQTNKHLVQSGGKLDHLGGHGG